jgi:hypothetical protein
MLLPVDSLWLQLLLLLPTYSTILGLSSSYEERGFIFFFFFLDKGTKVPASTVHGTACSR